MVEFLSISEMCLQTGALAGSATEAVADSDIGSLYISMYRRMYYTKDN